MNFGLLTRGLWNLSLLTFFHFIEFYNFRIWTMFLQFVLKIFFWWPFFDYVFLMTFWHLLKINKCSCWMYNNSMFCKHSEKTFFKFRTFKDNPQHSKWSFKFQFFLPPPPTNLCKSLFFIFANQTTWSKVEEHCLNPTNIKFYEVKEC